VSNRLRESIAPAGAIVAAFLAAVWGAPSLSDAREATRDAFLHSSDPAATRAVISRSMRRFPADYYFPLIRAELAESTGENPTPWVERALERAPSVGRVHFVLAKILARRGALSQAMLELRTSVELESPLDVTVGPTAIRWTSDPDMLERAVPDSPVGVRVFEAMVDAAAKRGDTSLAASLDERALARFPEAVTIRMRIVQRLREQLSGGMCASPATCLDALDAHAAYLVEHLPDSSRGEIVSAQTFVARNDEDGARAVLRVACNKPRDKQECLKALAEIETPDRLSSAIDRVVALGCTTTESCAATHDWSAGIYASRSLWAQAYGAAVKAARAQPSAERWKRAVGFATSAGLAAEQAAAEREAARMDRR
jgi:hypothetical protein